MNSKLSDSFGLKVIKTILNKSNKFVNIITTGTILLNSILVFIFFGLTYLWRFILLGDRYPDMRIIYISFLGILLFIMIIVLIYELNLFFREKEVRNLIFQTKQEVFYSSPWNKMKFTILNILIISLIIIIGIIIIALVFSLVVFFTFYLSGNNSFYVLKSIVYQEEFM